MELASPITIYWDLPPEAAESSRLVGPAAEIVDCRPLMVNITVTAATVPLRFGEVLARLRAGAAAVTLTVPDTAWCDVRFLAGEGLVRELFLAVDHLEQLQGWDGGERAGVGVSYAVTPRNWRALPDLARLCLDRGITRLVLPMQRLYGEEVPFFLTAREQQILTGALEYVGGIPGLTLTIHDPFLWRAFNPGIPFPQGGCQAANTMIAIAPDGGVYPCPTLPVRLGTLGEASLKEIIASTAKQEFRRKLLEHPDVCGGCAEVTVCRGGCRGRAYVMHQSLAGDDPACW